MERKTKKTRYTDLAGPPAVKSVKNNWEDGSTTGSRARKNDGANSKSSDRLVPDVTSSKSVGRLMRFATWNVRTLNMPGKLDNLIKEASDMDTDIMGIAETHYTDAGYIRKDNYIFINSGGESHARGVGFLLKKKWETSILGYWPINDRIILLKLKSKPFDISFIQIYAPTADHSDDEVEEFYDALNLAIKQTKSTDVLFVMGDFNAKVGSVHNNIVGKFGLGDRNERGTRLIQFCEENKLVVTNTWHQHPLRRRYTWKSPGDYYRNQIDYILIRERFRNNIKQARSFPGADIDSDHNPVLVKCALKLKNIQKNKPTPKIDVSSLRDAILNEYNVLFKNKFSALAVELDIQQNSITKNVEKYWANFKESINHANTLLPKKKLKAKKSWMNAEILELMEKRKKAKIDQVKYKELNTLVKASCNAAKEKWINEQCVKIEELEKKHYCREMHALAKDLSGKQKRNSKAGCIKSKDGTILFEQKKVLERWAEYIGDLFEDNRPEQPTINADSGPDILTFEVELALKEMKNNKSVGPDNINVEMLKALDSYGIEKLTTLCNGIYQSGNIPQDLLESVFITLPKKPKANECGDFRTISLMSHVIKVILKILLNRNQQKLFNESGNYQFGFKKGSGTREAIFCMRMITEKCLEKGKDIYCCFIDYAKAFDRVHHLQLINCLEQIGIDGKDLRVITNLYWQQKACVRIEEETSNQTAIKRGVRQGCVASPSLFSVYTENIFKEIKDLRGINIGGHNINNIRYADDTVLLAENENDLQILLNTIQVKSTQYGLDMNVKKTKTMVISRKEVIPNINIYVNGENLEQVTNFKYLGQNLFQNGKCISEIKQRIEIARARFHEMDPVLKSHKISLSTRMRLVKCYVFSALSYCCETWDINKEAVRRLNAFEMYIFRRLGRISWIDMLSNDRVLDRLNLKRELVPSLKERKLKYFGHVVRHSNLLKIVLQCDVTGKRSRGRQRRMWTDNLKEWTNLDMHRCNLLAQDREGWRSFVSNLRTGDAT